MTDTRYRLVKVASTQPTLLRILYLQGSCGSESGAGEGLHGVVEMEERNARTDSGGNTEH